MEERFRWMREREEGGASLAELCRKYGISRKTAYKWLRRYEEQGLVGLQDRESPPHQPANKISEEVERSLVELRIGHRTWGPKKLLGWMERNRPGQSWPALSTIGLILWRNNLSRGKAARQRCDVPKQPLAHATSPNDVWCIDFKGWFVCGDKKRCDPLTVTDAFSRYLFCCQAMERTDGPHTQKVMIELFRHNGLPDRIRSDNGTPFSANGGLSVLSVWWLRLGILPERIDPGKPQQNGRHERMHRTLKQETAQPPADTILQQQKRFDRFLEEYNGERPHEALQQSPPADHYVRSPRRYPEQLPEMVYPDGFQVRIADQNGKIRWLKARCKLGTALANQAIGVQTVADGLNHLWFGRQLLGVLDERRHRSGAKKRINSYWPPLQSPSGLLTRQPEAGQTDAAILNKSGKV